MIYQLLTGQSEKSDEAVISFMKEWIREMGHSKKRQERSVTRYFFSIFIFLQLTYFGFMEDDQEKYWV
ncbi:hypothetical protein GCM10027185_04410 [Spirosoma pulveris]